MEIKIFNTLPPAAMEIRTEVFVKEQGFCDEEDDHDKTATHLVLYDESVPIGTCRFFPTDESGTYLFGRLAILKQYRGMGLGRRLLQQAQTTAAARGGTKIILHAQYSAKAFYEANDFSPMGALDYEQGKAHIWMYKSL